MRTKSDIENYLEKAKLLIENGWETWYHFDNWIKGEWVTQGKRYDYMGRTTNDAYNIVLKEREDKLRETVRLGGKNG